MPFEKLMEYVDSLAMDAVRVLKGERTYISALGKSPLAGGSGAKD